MTPTTRTLCMARSETQAPCRLASRWVARAGRAWTSLVGAHAPWPPQKSESLVAKGARFPRHGTWPDPIQRDRGQPAMDVVGPVCSWQVGTANVAQGETDEADPKQDPGHRRCQRDPTQKDFYERARAEITINMEAPVHLTSLFLGLSSLTTAGVPSSALRNRLRSWLPCRHTEHVGLEANPSAKSTGGHGSPRARPGPGLGCQQSQMVCGSTHAERHGPGANGQSVVRPPLRGRVRERPDPCGTQTTTD